MAEKGRLCKKITENLYIGEFDILHELSSAIIAYDQYGVSGPLVDITCVINLSSRYYNPDEIPLPDIIIEDHLPVPQNEPMASDVTGHREKYGFAAECISQLILAGNVVLIVCDTGRKQSAAVAAKYVTAGKVATYEDIEFAYVSTADRERYKAINTSILQHTHDDKFVLPPEDKKFYESVMNDRICLSPAYRLIMQ